MPEDKAATIALAVVAARARGALIDACAAYREKNTQAMSLSPKCFWALEWLPNHAWIRTIPCLQCYEEATAAAVRLVRAGGVVPAAAAGWPAGCAAAAARQRASGHGGEQHLAACHAA